MSASIPQRDERNLRALLPLDEVLKSARPVSAGFGVPPQRRDFTRARGFRGPREASLLQFAVDPDGRPVSPANEGQPAQGAGECDERRHRSILLHSSSTPKIILLQGGSFRNPVRRDQMARANQLTIRILPRLPDFPAPKSPRPAGWRYFRTRGVFPASDAREGPTACRSPARSRGSRLSPQSAPAMSIADRRPHPQAPTTPRSRPPNIRR